MISFGELSFQQQKSYLMKPILDALKRLYGCTLIKHLKCAVVYNDSMIPDSVLQNYKINKKGKRYLPFDYPFNSAINDLIQAKLIKKTHSGEIKIRWKGQRYSTKPANKLIEKVNKYKPHWIEIKKKALIRRIQGAIIKTALLEHDLTLLQRDSLIRKYYKHLYNFQTKPTHVNMSHIWFRDKWILTKKSNSINKDLIRTDYRKALKYIFINSCNQYEHSKYRWVIGMAFLAYFLVALFIFFGTEQQSWYPGIAIFIIMMLIGNICLFKFYPNDCCEMVALVKSIQMVSKLVPYLVLVIDIIMILLPFLSNSSYDCTWLLGYIFCIVFFFTVACVMAFYAGIRNKYWFDVPIAFNSLIHLLNTIDIVLLFLIFMPIIYAMNNYGIDETFNFVAGILLGALLPPLIDAMRMRKNNIHVLISAFNSVSIQLAANKINESELIQAAINLDKALGERAIFNWNYIFIRMRFSSPGFRYIVLSCINEFINKKERISSSLLTNYLRDEYSQISFEEVSPYIDIVKTIRKYNEKKILNLLKLFIGDTMKYMLVIA